MSSDSSSSSRGRGARGRSRVQGGWSTSGYRSAAPSYRLPNPGYVRQPMPPYNLHTPPPPGGADVRQQVAWPRQRMPSEIPHPGGAVGGRPMRGGYEGQGAPYGVGSGSGGVLPYSECAVAGGGQYVVGAGASYNRPAAPYSTAGRPPLQPQNATANSHSAYTYTPPQPQHVYKMEDKQQEPVVVIFDDAKSSASFHHMTGDHGVSWLEYYPQFLQTEDAEEFLHQCQESIKFRSHTDRRGNVVPRKIAWFGKSPYTYSGIVHESMDDHDTWPSCLSTLKGRIEAHLCSDTRQSGVRGYIAENVPQYHSAEMQDTLVTALGLGAGVHFNSVLANLYSDNYQAVGWHSDDEYPLGSQPLIASLSLGAQRWFELRHKPALDDILAKERRADIKMPLISGSLLLMAGATQEDWQHRVPKEYHDRGARVNLTFRIMQDVD